MATLDNLDTIEDDEPLQKLLNDTSDFDDRKKIRARIRAIKEKKRQEREQERQKREEARQDEVKRKFRLAEEEKMARMKRFEDLAKERTIGAGSNIVEASIREKHKAAEEKKQKVLREFEEKAKDSIGKLGSKTEEAMQIKLKVADDMKKDKLDSSSRVATGTFNINNNNKAVSSPGFGGTVYGKSPAKPQGAKGAMAAFKQMDKTANPNTGTARNFGGGVQRSASSIKEMMLKWIQMMTKEYPIEITNFSTSWNDGMAFCALIHHFCPDAFDYSALDPKNREYNFTLAFDTAEKHADIAPLLDVEDMVRMKKPDWKCVFTYVQSFYRRFRNHESNQHTPIEQ